VTCDPSDPSGREVAKVHVPGLGKGLPFGAGQVHLFVLGVRGGVGCLFACQLGKDFVPYGVEAELVENGPEGHQTERVLRVLLGKRRHDLQVRQVLADGVGEGGVALGQAEDPHLRGEPAVGGAQHHGAGFLVALFEGGQVGVAASTAGQVHGVLGAKGLTHRTSAGPARVLVAALADHQDAGGLAGGTPLDQFEGVFPRLGGLPLVGEVDPGEVVDVSGRACHDEAGGDGGGAFVALAPAPVHVSGLVGAVGVGEQVEGAGVGGGQPVALGASQPSWERGHRYTDAGPFVVHVGGGGDVWRGTQLLDLGSELATDG